MTSVQLDRVYFQYPVYEMLNRSLKVSLMKQFAGGALRRGGSVVSVHALSDVSFALEPGDRLGLIGRNGSGKSTLLRLLAGLVQPSRGRLRVSGRVVPLIEKGLGLNPDFSGFENIELPLRFLGADDAEVRRARKEVPEFTGLGPFMHLPVRTYSEGMKARLAFALCTTIMGDVLVLDEWLGAGDIEFYERAQARLRQLLERTGIVVLATHSNELIAQVCNKAAWLDRGNLVMVGDAPVVIAAYTSAMHRGLQAVEQAAA